MPERAEVVTVAEEILEKRSRSYVNGSYLLARAFLELLEQHEKLERDHKQVIDNLSSVQARCTELLLENRSLRASQTS